MDAEIEAKIDAILAQFEGRETPMADAGRDNTRMVNRINRLAPLKRIANETTFHRNVTRYRVEGASRDLLVGAERAGGGVWRLIARWATEE